MADELTADQLALMGAIETLNAQDEHDIAIPLTALNQSIAALTQQNSKQLVKIQNALIKSIAQDVVNDGNALDSISVALLGPIQDQLNESTFLLTQLASAAGLTDPGDPLEAALVKQVAEEPQIAMSATLLIAIRELQPTFNDLVEVLREIRDRMPQVPVAVPGETPSTGAAEVPPIDEMVGEWRAARNGKV